MPAPATRSPYRLLVVEDYPPLRLALVKGLREAGFAVDATGDGIEAEWHATTTAFDTIILDIMLPGRDGLTVLANLRTRGVTTPVLMLTAKDTIADRIAGLDRGADDYLVKPFDFGELLARVRSLTRRQHVASRRCWWSAIWRSTARRARLRAPGPRST